MNVLFLCVANSARSQMAEALANHYWGAQHSFFSAGSHPGHPHEMAIKALKSQGISTSGLQSKHYDSIDLSKMDYIITLCHEEYCPHVEGKKLHWPFEDPSNTTEDPLKSFIATSKKIKEKLENFLQEANL